MIHVLSEAAAQTPEAEDDVAEQQALLPPKYIAELSIKGLEARQGQEVTDVNHGYQRLAVLGERGASHAVAIQLVLFKALRSLPILA